MQLESGENLQPDVDKISEQSSSGMAVSDDSSKTNHDEILVKNILQRLRSNIKRMRTHTLKRMLVKHGINHAMVLDNATR